MYRLAPAVSLSFLLMSLAAAGVGTAAAADSVIGTFTVKGQTHLFKEVSVTRTTNPAEPGSNYLVVLVSDVAVAAADRKPARLAKLASAGKVRAVRVVWKEGFDALTATPFHAAVAENGQPTIGGVQIDLQAYDEKRLEAQINSKSLGQDWHFKATLKAAVVPAASSADDFPKPVPVIAPDVERDTNASQSAGDATAVKRALGRLGYQATAEGFTRAVHDGSLEGVNLFVTLGTNPNTRDSLGYPVLMIAVMRCTSEPAGPRIDIVKALLAAKADVDPKDGNGSTPLLWSVTGQCPIEIPAALVAAGANVNVKAKGGGTPLMLAKVFQRADLVAVLQKAGAKE